MFCQRVRRSEKRGTDKKTRVNFSVQRPLLKGLTTYFNTGKDTWWDLETRKVLLGVVPKEICTQANTHTPKDEGPVRETVGKRRGSHRATEHTPLRPFVPETVWSNRSQGSRIKDTSGGGKDDERYKGTSNYQKECYLRKWTRPYSPNRKKHWYFGIIPLNPYLR